jgi:NAD(P)-dependent dehydrogenase (short-subunit alcohol dehydrogenase family)
MSHIAIITGSSRGIAAAAVRLAAAAGYDICINYARDAEAARKIAIEYDSKRPAGHRRASGCRTPISRVRRAAGSGGAAGKQAGIISQATTVADLTDDTLTHTFAVNVYGSVYCAREVIKRMVKSADGSGRIIVNVFSAAVQRDSPIEYVHYAASKAAKGNFTIGLAKEVGPHGIRVNALQAGATDTDIHVTAGNPERPAMVATNALLRRAAKPEDIANDTMWPVSAPTNSINGAVLPFSDGL